MVWEFCMEKQMKNVEENLCIRNFVVEKIVI